MKPYWSDGQVTLFLGDCLAVLPSLEAASINAICTDPPYGLEFMGREWDGADGFRRSLNPADAGRDSVFGRTSRTGPEYRTAGTGKRGAPGIGERHTEWVSNQGWNGFRCRNCGHLSHGGSPCQCEAPDFVRADNRWHLYQAWCEKWAAECLRVLKPGGHLLAFGGTRTWHRLTCAIEDAGFEIRNSTADLTGREGPGLMWIYSSGFPKSLDAGRAIDMHVCTLPGRHCMRSVPDDPRPDDHVCPESAEGGPWRGWGTDTKPAWEPIVVARKPLAGNVAANVLTHGAGALNVNGCRVKHISEANRAESEGKNRHGDFGTAQGGNQIYGDFTMVNGGARANYEGSAGRWPPNVVLGAEAANELDRQSGATASRIGKPRRSVAPGVGYGMVHTGTEYADIGGASRFFPVFRYEAKAGSDERPRGEDGTGHPTVKPVDLMRWLVRLVTPPGGLVLDPFAGSGATAEACIVEGFRCLLIEKDPASAELVRIRLRKPIQPDIFGGIA